EESAHDRAAEDDEPGVAAGGRDERERKEGEDRGAAAEPIEAVGEVHAVRHCHHREDREDHERDRADEPLSVERDEDARDAEVALDVDRGDEALLRHEVRRRPLAAHLLAHPQPAQEPDVRTAHHEAEKERGEHHTEREDRGGHQAAAGRTSASARRSRASECDPFTSTVSPGRRIRRRSTSASGPSATWCASATPARFAAATMVSERSPTPTRTSAARA